VCSLSLDVELEIWVTNASRSRIVATTATVWLVDFKPNETQRFSRSLSGLATDQSFLYFYRWYSHIRRDDNYFECVPALETTGCLLADHWLAGAISRLEQQDKGRWLLRVASEHHVTLVRGHTSIDSYGEFSPALNKVTLDLRIDDYSAWERAAVLAHELQHA